jgi:polyisoprenyl-phosphate glycosyltransferase
MASRLPGNEFEFLFIDDCSTDQTPLMLRELHQKDKRVKTIRFARNCGSHAALAAGLNQGKGSCAIALAADLQDPPDLIPQLIEKWKKGISIVWGVREKRKGETIFIKFFSRLYYLLMNWLSEVKIPPSGADVFLADRAVIDAYKEMTEKHTSVFMALAWLGFKQDSILYIKEARFKGKSKWTLGKRIKLALDSILAFSDVFIRYMSVLGIMMAFIGFSYALYVGLKFLQGIPVNGWSAVMVAIFIMGGLQMMMLGILGEYLWRTFDESRKRPRFVIEYKIE